MKKTDVVMALIAAIMLVVCVFIAFKSWTTGSSEDDYKIVCIGGHEYYRCNFAAKTAMGIRLDDNGKPIKCEASK